MRRMMGILGVVVSILVFASAFVPVAQASVPQGVVIQTSKPLGPAIGSFTASGAISDSGTFVTLSRTLGAVPSPILLVNNLTLRFDGMSGNTFTVRVDLREKPTADPDAFTSEGTWAIIDGTGAYAKLRGGGTVVGTVNDSLNLIVRTLTGEVHFD
jgi:hypothetical protein